jgi:hypothetical protein
LSNSTSGFSKSSTAIDDGACLIGPNSCFISSNQSLPAVTSGARRPVSRARPPTNLSRSDARARATLRVKHRLEEEQTVLGMLIVQSNRYSDSEVYMVRRFVKVPSCDGRAFLGSACDSLAPVFSSSSKRTVAATARAK